MTIKQVDIWLESTKKGLIDKYNQLGLRASGKWEKELETEQIQHSTGVKAVITGMNYTEQLEIGRLAGSFPPLAPIRQWIDDKGIIPKGITKDSLAFLIGRKIKEQGIKVPNKYNAGGLVTDVITDKRVNELVDSVASVVIKDVTSEIYNIFEEWQ